MRKLMWLTIGFCIAAAVGCYLLPTEQLLLAAGGCALLLVAALCALLRTRKARLCVMILLGMVLSFVWQSGMDVFRLLNVQAVDDQTLTVTIAVTDYSKETEYGAVSYGRVQLAGKSYRIRFYHKAELSFAPGDQVSGQVLLRSTLKQGSHASSYHRSKGVYIIGRIQSDIEVVKAQRLPWYGYPVYVREQVLQRIDEIFPEGSADFAKALLLGETEDLDHATDVAFKRSGIRHVIAVSGLHVSILFALIYAITLRRKWLSLLIGLPVLFFFAAVTGFSPSITRACTMYAIMVIGSVIQREYDAPTALAFAVLVMLLQNPWTVTDVSFQLSVASIGGILLFGKRIQNWLLDKRRLGRIEGREKRIASAVAVSLAISVSANVFTIPLCAVYFGMVSLLGVVTNLLALWVITYIFYGILLACAVSCLWMPLGTFVALVVSWAIRYVKWIAFLISDIPFSAVYIQSVYILLWIVLVYLLLTVYWMVKHKPSVVLVCCMTVGLFLSMFLSWIEPTRDECRVTVLDVGQGQCILLQAEGRNFLVDCGGDSAQIAADEAMGLLFSQGISQLDGLILTHYDEDHAAGALLLLEQLGTDLLILPDCVDDEGVRNALQLMADTTTICVSEIICITFEEAKITLIPSKKGQSDNESGLCVLFQTENCDILITGDRSDKGELELLESMQLPQLELLIVGHHGSKYATCRELLIKTKPQTAIISVGADNSYGHPAPEVLKRLEDIDCIVYRTDLDGTVIFRR